MKWVLIFIMFGTGFNVGGGGGGGHPPTVHSQRFDSLDGCQEAAKIFDAAARVNEKNVRLDIHRPVYSIRCVLDTKDGL
jgi:hypothetical protein